MATKDIGRVLWCAALNVLLLVAILQPVQVLAQVSDEFFPFVYDPAEPTILRLDGEIDLRTPLRLGNALDRYGQIDTLELASPGGSAYGALLMVDIIDAAGLKTVIPAGAVCYSSCSFLFFAGTHRAAEGELGVHQPAGADLSTGFVAMNDVLDVFDRFGVPADVRRRMLDTPPAGMYVFSGADLDRLGLIGPASVVAKAEAVSDAPAPEAAVSPEQPDEPGQSVLTVKPFGGDHGDIASALAAAPEGARIEVYPGTYQGGAEVTNSVDIVGIGPREQILWEARGGDVVAWRAAVGSLVGLTIRQDGYLGGGEKAAIKVIAGTPRIEDCDVSSSIGSAIMVFGELSAPRISASAIHDAAFHGIVIKGGAVDSRALIEANDIFANRISNILVADGAHPQVQGNTIRDGVRYGLHVTSNASGTFDDNTFSGNTGTGIVIETGADPVIRDNRIHDSGANGILVQHDGLGTILHNEIYRNKLSAVLIASRAAPVLRDNWIGEGKLAGVFVHLDGGGMIEGNRIEDNAGSGVVIASGADPVVRANFIGASGEVGVMITDAGFGTITGNQIKGSGLEGILVRFGSDPEVRGNKIQEGRSAGIRVTDNGRGTIERNDIQANAGAGIEIDESDATVVRGNRIHLQAEGIVVSRMEAGSIAENEIYDCSRGIVLLSGAAPAMSANIIHDCEPTLEGE